ncbi:MAG: hypothetical protein KGR98_09905, partial [Verrucomicrobia bacterium]|nr:hypothetical protein [Verrucomicrobiota bacterium]
RSSSSASVTILPYPTASYPATILSNNPAGYWRLNEPDNGLGDGNFGVAAHDYWGGNNGVYTNTTLGNPPFDANLEPTNTSAQFGFLSFSNCMALNIPNIDFSGPTNAEFSVECWENGYGQNADAGLVTKGYWGHEQFTLDFGAPGNAFRLSVRDAKGNIHNANSTNVPDGAWHYVAGVVDEANGAEMLYVDGALVASNDIPVGSGVLATTVPMAIGARDGDNAGDYTRQFAGTMNDVAVYNYALSPAQVLADYDSADIPAYVSSQPPASLVVDAGGTATIRAGLVGTPPLAIQWYSNSVAIPGATNSTLILSNVSSSADGSTYYVTVQNAYNTGGPVQSGTTTLTVVSGIPQIYVDVPTNSFALVGGTVSIPVTAYGSLPLTYQWQYDGVNLTDGGGITGSQVTDSSGSLIPDALIIAKAQQSEAGLYRVIVANSYGSVTSSASIFGVGSIGGSPLGFNNGTGWTPEQAGTFTAPIMANNVLELTDGAGSEARSFFYNTPLFIGSFRASFTYLESPGAGGADGITFCLQNDTRGATALGGGGGSLGVSGITPSWEFEINIYSGHVQGYALATDGSTGTYVVPGNVNVISGDPIDVSLVYAGGIMTVTMADATAGTSFTTTEQVDLPTHLGGEDAYVGFTGADGGVASIQQISNFEFFGLVPQQAIRATTANNTVTITWSQTFAGYRLQENSDLGTTNWVDVTSPLPQVVNGVNQVVVPLGSTNEFYRLVTP